MDLINEQNVEWTSLVQRQLTEMNTLRRQHTKEQCELLRLLLDETQRNQMKDMNDRHARYVRDDSLPFNRIERLSRVLERRKNWN
jgi:hypothetical protein